MEKCSYDGFRYVRAYIHVRVRFSVCVWRCTCAFSADSFTYTYALLSPLPKNAHTMNNANERAAMSGNDAKKKESFGFDRCNDDDDTKEAIYSPSPSSLKK